MISETHRVVVGCIVGFMDDGGDGDDDVAKLKEENQKLSEID